MQDHEKQGFARRSTDLYPESVLPSLFDTAQRRQETWRELVSVGAAFGLGMAGLAALVLMLA